MMAEMGPYLADALLVVTNVSSRSSQGAWKQLRVPRHMLSNSMQQLHQNGVSVTSVVTVTSVGRSTLEPDQLPVAETKRPRRRTKPA